MNHLLKGETAHGHAEAVRCGDQEIAEGCETLTDHLFRAGAILAAIFGGAKPRVSLDQGTIDRLEQRIDRICDDLAPLSCFIAPGGSELAARLHQARATARRAEGAVVSGLDRARHDGQPEEAAATVLRYLNRLSDCLFALARQANHNAGVEDRPWAP
mgnify:CR=1 FL=1